MPAPLVFDDREIARAAFDDAARRSASGFERLGVGDGDVVCVMLRNEPAFLEAVLGARRLGAYSCPINWHYKADEAGWMLADSGAKVLVVAADLLPEIASGIPPGVAVVVARPEAVTVATSGSGEGETRIPPGRPEWREWLASHPPHAGPERTPRGNMPYSATNSSGVPPAGSSPIEANRSTKSGERIAAFAAAFSLSSTGRGNPAGAMTPVQVPAS